MNKIKLLKASPFYDKYLKNFYIRNPHLYKGSYIEQYQALMNDCFGWSDFWKTHLEETGQFEVQEIIVNAEYLQKQWAKENQIKYLAENWEKDILESQIKTYNPDIFFAHAPSLADNEFLRYIRKKAPSIKKVICWDGVASNNIQLFQGCDLMLTCLDSVADYYRSAGISSYKFSFGFAKQINNKLIKNRNLYNVSFVGGINLFEGGHFKRLETLVGLSRKMDLDLFLGGKVLNDWQLYKWAQRNRLLKGNLKEAIQINQLGKKNKGETFGIQMYQILADSKISLNIHIDRAKNKAANIRLFEATGTGTCLLTDWKDNITEYFKPDVEIVTFNTVNDCIDKIKFLLNNENERIKIAYAGQKRTLENYSIKQRIQQIIPILLA